jgi:hypothetical protein
MAHWQLRGDSPVSSQGEAVQAYVTHWDWIYRRPQEGAREARPEWPARRGTCPKRGPGRRGQNGPPEEALSPEGQSRFSLTPELR